MGKYQKVKYGKGRKPKFGLNIKTRYKAASDKEKTGSDDAPVKAGYDESWIGPGHLTLDVREHLELYQSVLIPGEIQRDYNNTKEGKAQIRVMYQGDTWLRREAKKRGIDWDARASSKRRNQSEVKKLAKSVGMPARTLVSALRSNWSSDKAETRVLRKAIPIKNLDIKLGKNGTVIRTRDFDGLDDNLESMDKMAKAIQDLLK